MLDRGRSTTELIRRLWRQGVRDDVLGLSAELAYRFFLAIFPFFIFLASLGKPVSALLGWPDPAGQLSELLSQVMPAEAAGVLQTEIARVIDLSNPGLLQLSLAGALWVATGGTAAVMKAANRAYSVEETRPWWRRYLTAVALTVWAGLAIVGGFVLVMAALGLGAELASLTGLQPAYQWALELASWPVVGLLLTVGISVLYRLGPNVHVRWRDAVSGALVFTVGWLIGTGAFGSYVDHVGSYGLAYGTLAGVVVLLVWFYLTGFLLLLGLEVGAVNAQYADQGQLEAQQRRTRQEREIRQLPPDADREGQAGRLA